MSIAWPVVGLAIDHRDSLRAAAARKGLLVDTHTLASFKSRVVHALAPGATLVLLDHELGADALRQVPEGCALVMPLEAQGYEAAGQGRLTTLLEDFSPARAVALGAAGCKLLLPYRPDLAEAARAQEALVTRVRDACRDAGTALVLEPIVHGLEGEPFTAAVVASAGRLAALGPDVLKLQFPQGAADEVRACRALTEACGAVPWVLLGGGADGGVFLAQLEMAMAAGARGFIAGRTIWDAALVGDERAGDRALRDVCVPLFQRAARIARAARPAVLPPR